MDAIVFDFGNVIAHFDHRLAVRRFVRHSALSEDAIFDAIYNTALEDDFEAGRIGAEEFVRRACSAIGYRVGPDEFRAAFVDIFTPNPEMCALIPRLKGRYRLALASNTNELHAAHFRPQFADVLRHFDAVGVSYEAGARKPDRGFYAHCHTLIGAPPDRCLFIDDLPANVEGARAFGWQAVHFTGYPELLKQLRGHGVEV
jgi:putative hydrolase of the HAD superfamily